MSMNAENTPTLEQDAILDQPLRRVNYEAGMMLGLEASREEQEYHRRRLTRHQYWLHGSGTLAGMVVSIDPQISSTPDENETVRILVGPGIGIDGLGREVLVHEAYCINLGEWLEAQNETTLREGYSDIDNLLWLKVTVRYKDCESGVQPVLARKLNLGTDPVQPSRMADSVMLEIQSSLPIPDERRYQPWAAHNPIDDALPDELTTDEQALIADASGATADQLQLHARLLHALNDTDLSAQTVSDELEAGARLLLAHIAIDVTDINDILVNPLVIRVNNLVRPFLTTASQLAYLARQD